MYVEIPEGISIITALGMNEVASPRSNHYLPLFKSASAPRPEQGDWSEWIDLVAGKKYGNCADPRKNIFISAQNGFGTLSSSLIALEGPNFGKPRIHWKFSESPQETNAYYDVNLN